MPVNGPYVFKKADGRALYDENLIRDGEWSWIDRGEFGVMIYARCPDCHQLMTLYRKRGEQEAQGHHISGSGEVSPSVLHRFPVNGVETCGFHSIPTRLEGFIDIR